MAFQVETGYPDGRAHHWWAKFLVYGWEINGDLQESLDKHNSNATINVSGYRIGDIIEFDTEHDFTIFVLKWS